MSWFGKKPKDKKCKHWYRTRPTHMVCTLPSEEWSGYGSRDRPLDEFPVLAPDGSLVAVGRNVVLRAWGLCKKCNAKVRIKQPMIKTIYQWK